MVRDLTRALRAKENFLSGDTCAQAVLLAFADLTDADERTLRGVARPMGGGMGRLRLTCGCVSGGAMALGLLFPDLGKSELYALVQEFAKRFRESNGSVLCGELLARNGIRADTRPEAEARTPDYYKKRPCGDLAYDAARILGEMLEEHGFQI